MRSERGANLVETALVVLLIALIAIPSIKVVGIGVRWVVCRYAHEGDQPGTFDSETGTYHAHAQDPFRGDYF